MVEGRGISRIPPLQLPKYLSSIYQVLLEMKYSFQKAVAVNVSLTMKSVSFLFHLYKAFEHLNMSSVQWVSDHVVKAQIVLQFAQIQ